MALLFCLICCIFAFILREKAAVWCRFVTFSLFVHKVTIIFQFMSFIVVFLTNVFANKKLWHYSFV